MSMTNQQFETKMARLSACIKAAQEANNNGEIDLLVDAINDCNALSRELQKELNNF